MASWPWRRRYTASQPTSIHTHSRIPGLSHGLSVKPLEGALHSRAVTLSLPHVTSKKPPGKRLVGVCPKSNSVLALTPEVPCGQPPVSTSAVSSLEMCVQAISVFLICTDRKSHWIHMIIRYFLFRQYLSSKPLILKFLFTLFCSLKIKGNLCNLLRIPTWKHCMELVTTNENII